METFCRGDVLYVRRNFYESKKNKHGTGNFYESKKNLTFFLKCTNKVGAGTVDAQNSTGSATLVISDMSLPRQ
jgi:hypothetical protein